MYAKGKYADTNLTQLTMEVEPKFVETHERIRNHEITHFLRVVLSYLFRTNEVTTGGTVWLKNWQIMGDVWTL